jgi:hypothetical protein
LPRGEAERVVPVSDSAKDDTMQDTKRFTLSELPLPAKLTITVFLLSIGLGYVSAMVQLHMKDTKKDGTPMPGVDDVQTKYCSYTEYSGTYPGSKFESIISGDPNGAFSKSNMAAAFFSKSEGYAKEIKNRTAPVVEPEREGERQALLAWVKLDTDKRKATYEADAFEQPTFLKDKPITADYLDNDKIKVKTIIEDRCARCHDGMSQSPALNSWDALATLTEAPRPELFNFAGKSYVKNDKQTSLEGLTQTTHNHLFGFSMLYFLSGMVLAFTRYPTIVKVIFCPLALLGATLDVSCWWLSRLEPPYGPLFAAAILGTGGIAALTLAVQIFLSLFDMYGKKGKIAVAILLLAGLGGGGFTIGTKVVKPYLDAEKARAEK